jgi:two-component system chemotaxis response regulator CheY
MDVARDLPILVVDDYPVMRRIVGLLLCQLGFTDVDEAADGAIALAMLRRRAYGLVIVDWGLQPMTGVELVRALRADARLAAVPCLMLSAENVAARAEAALAAGTSGWLLKPFHAAALHRQIAGLIRVAA